MAEKIEKSDAEWRRQLTPEQYQVMRQRGTERPFTGSCWNEKRPGVYRSPVATRSCSSQTPSSNWAPAGPALPAGRRGTGRGARGQQPRHGADGGDMRPLRRSSRARLPRRPAADRPAVLPQFRCPPVRGQPKSRWPGRRNRTSGMAIAMPYVLRTITHLLVLPSDS